MISNPKTSEVHDDIDPNFSDIRLIANPDVILKNQSADSTILLDPFSGRILKINPLGFLIWQLMDGTRTTRQIIVTIRDTFLDAPASMDQDVIQFIAELFETGFIGKLIR